MPICPECRAATMIQACPGPGDGLGGHGGCTVCGGYGQIVAHVTCYKCGSTGWIAYQPGIYMEQRVAPERNLAIRLSNNPRTPRHRRGTKNAGCSSLG